MAIRRVRLLALAMMTVVALMATGCGDDSDSTTPDETSSTADSGSTTTPPTSEPSTSSSTSSSTTVTTTTGPPTTPLPDDQLPGTASETAPAAAGQVLAVIGVQFDDVLNVRLAPGTDNPVVAELDPLASDFAATGRARTLTSSAWWEVTTTDGTVGWVSSRFAAIMGPTSDATSAVVDELGAIPQAETMTDLGTLVAGTFAPDPDQSRLTLTVAPSVGDLGEVTYDVVGLGDDARAAVRLHVFGQPLDSGEGFSLKSVESTDMCARGLSESDGICV